MGRARFAATVVAVVVLIGLGATTAEATFHEWKISEVYSNATGTVQFIEFLQPSFSFDDERFVAGQTLTDAAFGHTFTFGSSLPNQPPPSSHFLVATPGYAALSGVPAADYVLPANNFFNTAGDTLTFATFVDQLQFTGAQFPTNGTSSLNRDYGATTLTTARNSPTNFAGQSGSVVPEPATAGLLACGAVMVLRRHRAPRR
jgi:serralysin